MRDVVCEVVGYFQDDPFHTARQRITSALKVIEGYSPIQSGAHKGRHHTSSGEVDVVAVTMTATMTAQQQRNVSSSLCDKSVIGSHSYKELLFGLNEDILPCRA